MQTAVLLSIKPEFADAIFEGRKKFEFRKAVYQKKGVNKVVVYASSPVQKVIGEFSVEEILSLETEKLWRETQSWAGITKSYFEEYFSGRNTGHALKVKKARRYRKPLSLQKDFGIGHPPQSFRYIETPIPALQAA